MTAVFQIKLSQILLKNPNPTSQIKPIVSVKLSILANIFQVLPLQRLEKQILMAIFLNWL